MKCECCGKEGQDKETNFCYGYSECCFCEHKYLSEYCRECPVREDPMPDEVDEEDD